ncbi:MAG: kynureninase [Gemmatimonadetes bacterium]|nr:kynureninase [Gemmatimonadota bacterium]
MTPEALYEHPNALAPHYSRFRVGERLLLTGHSHQAWPDCGFDGQRRAWWDAAELVDRKWDEAFARAERVRRGFARLLGSPDAPDTGDVTLGSNTHELVVRFLSALDLRERPRLVTTDGEFHSIRRQLDRLAECGIEIVRVAARPSETLSERLADAVDDRTAAALVSCVLFKDARIVRRLRVVADRCDRVGAHLLIDTYHALNVVPFDLAAEGLGAAFAVGGGYKYCQLGEGNCFLRVPPGCDLRPVVTGWFAEFSALEGPTRSELVPYGSGPDRFAGSTYDPTSHYRAAEVFAFFEREGLSAELLREVSAHQIERLANTFDEADLPEERIRRDRSVELEDVGGFLALETPYAEAFQRALAARRVWTDHRDETLRLGPAPYLSDRQLEDAIAAIVEVASEIPAT